MMHNYSIPEIPEHFLHQIVVLERRAYVTKYERGTRVSVLRASSKNVGVMKHGHKENKIISKSKAVTHFLRQNRMLIAPTDTVIVIGGLE